MRRKGRLTPPPVPAKGTDVSADLIPVAPHMRLRIGVSGHRVPPKLPNESVLPLRPVVDSILAAIVGTTHACENDFEGIQSESARNTFKSEAEQSASRANSRYRFRRWQKASAIARSLKQD